MFALPSLEQHSVAPEELELVHLGLAEVDDGVVVVDGILND